MILSAGDLAIEISTDDNKPGVIQRFKEGRWSDYVVDGEPVTWPPELERLEPGRWRL